MDLLTGVSQSVANSSHDIVKLTFSRSTGKVHCIDVRDPECETQEKTVEYQITVSWCNAPLRGEAKSEKAIVRSKTSTNWNELPSVSSQGIR